MKSSTFTRAIELAKLATRVGIKELTSKDFKSRIEQAALIVQSLSNLKGAAMKAGQLLSLDLNHYFPPEAIEILSQLQNAAVAHPFNEIEAILLRELGQEKYQKIMSLSQTPIGVASIGQVHRAEYQGRSIVLKIQYPGVADSIESDLKILKGIAASFCQLTGRKMDLGPLFKEFHNILEQEVDYRKEVSFQKQYQNLVKEIPAEVGFRFHVPGIVDELCTDKVIAMSFEPGLPLRQWIATNPSKSKRERLAKAILDLYFREFFEWGLVQTDPNWANFLVDESNDQLHLVLLDFGATRVYPRQFIQNYIRLLQFSSQNQSAELKAHAIEFGLIDPRESDAAFEAFEELMKTAIRPFFVNNGGSPLFDFSDPQHSLNSQNASKVLADRLVYSPPPYNLIFLHRKLAGVYSILKSLEVKFDVSGYWQKMQEFSNKS